MEASEDRVVVRRMDVWSTARLSLVVYALVGLVFGVFWAVLMGSMGSMGWPGAGPMGAANPTVALFAVIAPPVFYAVAGFVGGAIMAFLYNLVAGWVGGIELDLGRSSR